MVTWGSAAFEEFESNTTLEELVTTFETSKGWTVKKEVEVDALFFVVNRVGTRFLATADNGGKASINVHSKPGEDDIIIVKWLNYVGKDGLNARILPNLPIHRGAAGEFYFKSISSNGGSHTRKTIFALKIKDQKEANDFHMWWLRFNGSLDPWFGATEKAASERSEKILEILPDLPEFMEDCVVSISDDIYDQPPLDKRKRPMELVSPRSMIGVGPKKFRFDECTDASVKGQPFVDAYNRPIALPEDTRSDDEIARDESLHVSEVKKALLFYLNTLHIYDGGPLLRCTRRKSSRFSLDVAGVPLCAIGHLFTAADQAARDSRVEAVRMERAYMDRLIDSCMPDAYQMFNANCTALPIIRFAPAGNSPIDRKLFQSLSSKLPVIDRVGAIDPAPGYETASVAVAAPVAVAVVVAPKVKGRARRGLVMYDSEEASAVSSSEDESEEDEEKATEQEVIVVDSSVPASQQITW